MMTAGGIVALRPVANKTGALTARRGVLRGDPAPACNGGCRAPWTYCNAFMVPNKYFLVLYIYI